MSGKRELYTPTPPSALVGERGYPEVRIGLNLTPVSENPALYDNPREWWGRLGIDDIVRMRASMIFSNKKAYVKAVDDKFIEAVLEASSSTKPVYSEVVFKKPPTPRPIISSYTKPVGMQGEVEKIRLDDNPKIPRRVDRLIEEKVKAAAAVVELYSHGFDVYYIQRLFSAAGLGAERRLVPTRWAITSVDKILSDHLLKTVKNYKEIPGYNIHHVEYIGNKYTVMLVPGTWSMEMIEIWHPRTVWVKGAKPFIYRVYELEDGKPSDEDGGYYAIRLPVLEHLGALKRQAKVLVVREVTREYIIPVGSWQIRESIRNALKKPPVKAETINEALKIFAAYTSFPPEWYRRTSTIVKLTLYQRKITDYLKQVTEKWSHRA